MKRAKVAAFFMIALPASVQEPVTAEPMSYSEFLKLPQPPAPRTIAYGSDPLQHVELWRPVGPGPFPVVLLIHGGCWQTGVGTASIMHAAAADLMKRGIAVWSLEYRGVDMPGGGYPGTFRDVAAGTDLLAKQGPALGLSVDHVVAVGHSAGGHLAFWLAGRRRIGRGSVLWSGNPLPIAGVVSLGGLPDLAEAATAAAAACGVDTVARLVGMPDGTRRDVYADTSPVALAPIGGRQVQINGTEDGVAPPVFATRYAARVAAAGDRPQLEVIPGAGHFELINPPSEAWRTVVAAVRRMLR